MDPPATSPKHAVLFLAVSLGAGLLMVSSDSLWIDEGQTWLFARQPSLSAWVDTLLRNGKSEAQMPLSMWLAWCAARLLGTGEWQMRAVNLLWVGLAGLAMGLVGRRTRTPALLPLFLLHPFVWFYANEARPYALLICAGAWQLYFLVLFHQQSEPPVWAFWALGATMLSGMASSLLFAFAFAGIAPVLLWIGFERKHRLTRRHWMPLAATILCLGLTGTYYLWTLLRGAGGAKIWAVGTFNLGYSFYELLGYGGLGPPRSLLRELGRQPGGLLDTLLQPRYCIGLAALSFLYGVFVARGLWQQRQTSLFRITIAVFLLSLLSLLVAAKAVGFPFWGRHLAYALPLVVLLAGLGIAPPAEPARVPARVLGILLFLCLATSTFCQRWHREYRKDDYRGASRLASKAVSAGKKVWWVADHMTAEYYGLVVRPSEPGASNLVFFNSEMERDPEKHSAPDFIFLSKPDIHDPEGRVRTYVDRMGYAKAQELSAFILFAHTNQNTNAILDRDAAGAGRD